MFESIKRIIFIVMFLMTNSAYAQMTMTTTPKVTATKTTSTVNSNAFYLDHQDSMPNTSTYLSGLSAAASSQAGTVMQMVGATHLCNASDAAGGVDVYYNRFQKDCIKRNAAAFPQMVVREDLTLAVSPIYDSTDAADALTMAEGNMFQLSAASALGVNAVQSFTFSASVMDPSIAISIDK